MSKAAEFYEGIRKNPFAILEFVWGLVLIADGFYLLLPAYEPQPGSVLVAFAGTPEVANFIAAFYIVAGLVATTAAFFGKIKWRIVGVFLLFLAFFFTVLIRLLTVGLVPTVWIWPSLLAITAAVDYWNLKSTRRSK